jgi:hypothetical protein
MDSLPLSFKQLFWDIDFSSLDKEKNKNFVIERVLEFGDISHFEELKRIYSIDEIKEVLRNSKNISFKSANFYALMLNVPRKEVLCLNQPLTLRQDKF